MYRNNRSRCRCNWIVISCLSYISIVAASTGSAFVSLVIRPPTWSRRRHVDDEIYCSSPFCYNVAYAYNTHEYALLMSDRQETDYHNNNDANINNQDDNLYQSWSIQQILKELDERDIRYSPTSTRNELENLLTQHNNKNENNESSNHREEKNLDESILERQRRRSKRRRQQQQQQLMNGNSSWLRSIGTDTTTTTAEKKNKKGTTVTTSGKTTSKVIWDGAKRKVKRLSRKAIDYFVVDEETGVRNVPYQYVTRNTNNDDDIGNDDSNKDDDNNTVITDVHVEVMRTKRNTNNYDKKSDISKTYYDQSTASQQRPRRPQSRPRQQQPRTNQYQSSTFTRSSSSKSVADNNVSKGENGNYFYNYNKNVRPRNDQEVRPRRRRPTSSSSQRNDISNTKAQKQQRSSSQEKSKSTVSTIMTKNLPRLPPSSDWQPPAETTTNMNSKENQQRQQKEVFRRPKKKIYSPYNDFGEDNNDDIYKDAVDRIGDFVADTADKFMWGMYDDNDDDANKNRKTNTNQQGSSNSKSTNASARTRNNKHWKDRLEEQLDSMLGVHENGDFYNKWTERFAQDEYNDNNNDEYDPFSIAQGRQRRRKQQPSYPKSFWEDGSILGVLFGRRSHSSNANDLAQRRGGRDNYDLLESGSVLSILRATCKSALSITSYLCRWASTQGAIPQPVVVIALASVGLTAAPKRRLLSMAITLLVVRTIGELLQGYEYSYDDWYDYNNEKNYDDDEEDKDRNNKIDDTSQKDR